MNTFSKTILLALAGTNASAHTIGGNSQLRAQVEAAANTGDACMPNERPQAHSKTADKARLRFNFEDIDAICASARDDRQYEWGEFYDIADTDDCADACTNGPDRDMSTELTNLLRGFNYNCPDAVCQCLYDEGTMTASNAGVFDKTNYQTRSRKAVGSITRTLGENGWYCFKLVGAELSENGLEFYHQMHALMKSYKNL